MINVCSQCGLYRADKNVDAAKSIVICPECGHERPFYFSPLYLVGGASGTGKSAVVEPLLRLNPPAVVLEADILWRPEFDKPDEEYRDFFETWLRLAKNMAQNGRPPLLLGAGLVVREKIERCVEARYFSQIHYLALTCRDDLLVSRLQARPAWRGSGTPAFIEEQLAFNRWCCEQQGRTPNFSTLDTSDITLNDAADRLLAWVQSRGSG